MAALNSCFHALAQGQALGSRSRVRRADRVIRAGTVIRCARMVAVTALAWNAPARAPAARVRADLTTEWLALDAYNGWRAVITGPGIAPIVVAAIASCHGAQALIDHPAIAPLRAQVRFPTTAVAAGPTGRDREHAQVRDDVLAPEARTDSRPAETRP